MRHLFQHFFLPHHTNNHRPKLFHHKSLIGIILFLVLFSWFGQVMQREYPAVLGISANISVEELLALTNQKRQEQGKPPLTLNSSLSQAAERKAANMFAQNYWAHVAPDGTTPWYFIKNAGYEYLYAGENLARGFTAAPEIVDAWMASPTHRENMLSSNYTEIGFAIKSGSLTGSETILVVELFGSPYVGDSQKQAQAQLTSTPVALTEQSPSSPLPTPTVVLISQSQKDEPTSQPVVAAIQNQPLVDTKDTGRSLAFFLLGVFLIVLVVDMIVVQRKKIARVVAHNLDHIIFLLILLIAAILFGKGLIL